MKHFMCFLLVIRVEIMLIINGYFRFCDMCATSGANALIVS